MRSNSQAGCLSYGNNLKPKRIFEELKYKFYKIRGLQKLGNFEAKEAIIDLKKALALETEDKELHFALACAYSLLEETDLGFHHLHCIAKYTKRYKDDILTNDKLAFLRTQPKYEAFYKSYLI